jgi:glycerophosphoryl diester phosphodiesterase
MHLLDRIARPVVIAHRGASAHAPENTLAAFRLALEHGADGVELDAKLSADGHVMVIHDQTVDRTTGGHGRVRELTLAQLKKLDAGSHFDSSFAREQIPTLDEVFVAVGARTLVNLELTNYASPADKLPDKVADLVIKFGLQEHILFSTFHPLTLIRIRRRLPQVPVALLAIPGGAGGLARGWLGRLLSPKALHPYYTDVSAKTMAAEKRRERMVNAWTVNDPEEMRRLFQMGIDGIITDDPRLARRVLDA